MTGLIITAANKADLKLFSDLARRIGIKTKPMSDEDILDYGLLKAMEEGRKTKFISRERVMKKLKFTRVLPRDKIYTYFPKL